MRMIMERSALQRFARCTSGNIAVIGALTMPMIVGLVGLGVDTGYWFFQNRELQGAADIAAYDAAVVLNFGGTTSAATTAATTGATANGWSSASGTITVNSPPTSGTHKTSGSIEVILTKNVPRFFSAIYSSSPVTIQARAVGLKNGSHVACVIALSPNAAKAIDITGTGNLNSPNCDIVSDSSASNAINMTGGGQLTSPCIVSVGTAVTTAGLTLTKCTSPTNHAPVASDPYNTLATPAVPGACISVSGHPTTLSPGYYCHGLNVNWSAATTFQPGVYYIDGGNLQINGSANVSGSGVTFYLAAGSTVTINGGANVTFSAPTSGTYSGITFFGDRAAASGSNSFVGGSSSVITGVIYFPTEAVSYSGGSNSGSDCTQVVANTVSISGNADFNSTCAGDGFSTIAVSDGAPGAVALAE